MENLAYEGFCPSCHNYWLFCDCVATFGTTGEDLAVDEEEEQSIADDHEEEVDLEDWDDWVEVDKSDIPLDLTGLPPLPGDDYDPDLDNDVEVDDILSPPPAVKDHYDKHGVTPIDSNVVDDTPAGGMNPTQLFGGVPYGGQAPKLKKPPYRPERGRPPVYKTPYVIDKGKGVPTDAGRKKQKLWIDQAQRAVDAAKVAMDSLQDMDVDKQRKPKRPRAPDISNPNPGKKKGARLADYGVMDVQYRQYPTTDPIDLNDYLEDINKLVNTQSNKLPYNASNLQVIDLHKGYQFNGEPDIMRTTPRGQYLMSAGMPVFTGPMYTQKLDNKNDKQSIKYLSKEYTDFLENTLKPWLAGQDKNTGVWWEIDCQFTSPNELGVQNLNNSDRQVIPSRDGYIFIFKSTGEEITVNTKMKLSQEFAENVTPSQLKEMIFDNGHGNIHFKLEYSNGTPRIQTRTVRKQQTVFRQTNGVVKIGGSTPLFSDGSGTRQRREDEYFKIRKPVIPPPPPVGPLTNNVLNTRRLQGSGTLLSPFFAPYENYNLGKYIQPRRIFSNGTQVVGMITTQDNLGDPLNQLSIGCGDLTINWNTLRVVHEMINERNTVPTYGICSLTFQSQTNRNIPFSLYSVKDKTDPTQNIHHEVRLRENGVTTTIRQLGDSSSFTVQFKKDVPVEIIAFVKCDPGETTYDRDRGGNMSVYFRPEITFLDNYLKILNANILVRTTTQYVSYEPSTNITQIAGERVGYGSIIPNTYRVPGTNTPMTLQDISEWSKLFVFGTNTLLTSRINWMQGNTIKYRFRLSLNSSIFPGLAIPLTGAGIVTNGTTISPNIFEVDPTITSYSVTLDTNPEGSDTSLISSPLLLEREITSLKFSVGWAEEPV